MLFWSPASEHIPAAAEALRCGKLVGMPTETVYGLAGNALDPRVVASIFEAKGRPTFDPLIVHTASAEAAFALCENVPALARRLAERFWPGPLTLVLPRRSGLPDLLSAGLPTLALRVPAHPIALRLIREAGIPLAAPSANRFGQISPTDAVHVRAELGDRPEVAGVLDAGPCPLGVESTVVGFPSENRAVVFRLGATTLEVLREEIEGLEVLNPADALEDPELVRRGEQSPGMLARHYAPRTPLVLLEEGAAPLAADGRTGFLCFSDCSAPAGAPCENLSAKGDLTEAAMRLFACMRRLDSLGLDRIVAWRVPDRGLGRAINDRLIRASR